VEQKGFHRFDVLDHSILACDYAARIQAAPAVRLAALFHDVGKPVTRKPGGTGLWTFYRHERESARLAQAILRRYRYPALFIESVVHLIAEHMFHYDETWSDAAVRRFIIRAGEANLPELYDLRRADAYAATGTELPRDFLAALIRRVDLVLAGSRAFSLRDLAVSGRDLITLGIPPGKRLGIILGELLETVVDDPAQNTREKLLDIAAALYARETGNAPTA
jgi:hypothetical protein